MQMFRDRVEIFEPCCCILMLMAADDVTRESLRKVAGLIDRVTGITSLLEKKNKLEKKLMTSVPKQEETDVPLKLARKLMRYFS